MGENPSGSDPDRQSNSTDAQDTREAPLHEQKSNLVRRLANAGLDVHRFIDVAEGRKQSFDHEQLLPDDAEGNYGVYSGRGLIGFDIDDYADGVQTERLDRLPETFTVETAHGGEHRYYRAGTGAVEAIRAATGGSSNVSLHWGEIYAGGKYLVGPGSEVEQCDKSNCSDCKRLGSNYSIDEDRPITEISHDQIRSLLTAEPDGTHQATQTALASHDEGLAAAEETKRPSAELSSPSSEVAEIADDEERLWAALEQLHQLLDAHDGVTVERLLGWAEVLEIGRFPATEHLMAWLREGRITKTPEPNRIAPTDSYAHEGSGDSPGEQRGFDKWG